MMVDRRPYYILAVDPGTSTIGFAVLRCRHGLKPRVMYADTLDASKGVKFRQYEAEQLGNKFVRLTIISDFVTAIYKAWPIDLVIFESPFLGRFPQSFKGLVEVTQAMKDALYQEDMHFKFTDIDPKSVKNKIGVSGGSKDKDDMYHALLNYEDIEWGAGVFLDELDEHAVDAVAVGLYGAGKVM